MHISECTKSATLNVRGITPKRQLTLKRLLLDESIDFLDVQETMFIVTMCGEFAHL